MPQLFLAHHYDALSPAKSCLDTEQANRERGAIKDQLLWLNDFLSPFIKRKGWDIHNHHQNMHLASATHFWAPGVDNISWLWLHYGKSKSQLSIFNFNSSGNPAAPDAFYEHTRIQFYLTNSLFGVWLLFTDTNKYDKTEFFLKINRDPAFKQNYWSNIQNIFDQDFKYVVEGEPDLPLVTGLSQVTFFNYIAKSRFPDGYSGIQKTYQPDDLRISVDCIANEMSKNLELLYPLYLMMSIRNAQQQPKQQAMASNLSKLFGGNAVVKTKKK